MHLATYQRLEQTIHATCQNWPPMRDRAIAALRKNLDAAIRQKILPQTQLHQTRRNPPINSILALRKKFTQIVK